MTHAQASWPTWARLAVPLAIGLLAIGCGDGDDDEVDAQPYIDATVEDLDDDDFPLGEEQAECMATTVVEAVGADRLEDEGIDPEEFGAADSFAELDIELEDDAVEQMGEDIVACDLGGALVEAFAAEVGGKLSDASLECMVDGLDDEELGRALALGFVDGDDPEAQAQVGNAVLAGIATCPDATTELVVHSIEQAGGIKLSGDGQACIADYLEAHPDDAAQVFTDGGANSESIGQQIGLACAEFLAR